MTRESHWSKEQSIQCPVSGDTQSIPRVPMGGTPWTPQNQLCLWSSWVQRLPPLAPWHMLWVWPGEVFVSSGLSCRSRVSSLMPMSAPTTEPLIWADKTQPCVSSSSYNCSGDRLFCSGAPAALSQCLIPTLLAPCLVTASQLKLAAEMEACAVRFVPSCCHVPWGSSPWAQKVVFPTDFWLWIQTDTAAPSSLPPLGARLCAGGGHELHGAIETQMLAQELGQPLQAPGSLLSF